MCVLTIYKKLPFVFSCLSLPFLLYCALHYSHCFPLQKAFSLQYVSGPQSILVITWLNRPALYLFPLFCGSINANKEIVRDKFAYVEKNLSPHWLWWIRLLFLVLLILIMNVPNFILEECIPHITAKELMWCICFLKIFSYKIWKLTKCRHICFCMHS